MKTERSNKDRRKAVQTAAEAPPGTGVTPDLKTQLGLVAEAEYARMRGVDVFALRNERCKNLGPPYIKDGRAVFYPIEGLRKYMAKQAITPSQAGTLIDGNKKRGARCGAAA
jgi:hypothetical protein